MYDISFLLICIGFAFFVGPLIADIMGDDIYKEIPWLWNTYWAGGVILITGLVLA